MVRIFIDNRPCEAKADTNLLEACLELGFDIPYFCWHPAMHSVGACRMCAVKQFKDEKDTRGRIIMSCMTPVTEDMRISIDDPQARAHRAGISELLMINHPHDCPVCDEGGECHLQDMTLLTGHVYRRFRFKKRTYSNQDLGPFLNHEMNRCIHCYRCVRFYRDYAGGRDLAEFASHHHVYFGRHEEGPLENFFSGNLVEVCPTGVFTDKTFKNHPVRKWDLQTAPSLCVHCSLGCNTMPGERYGELRRICNRYHHEVNGYFLCDRGRFGYEFVNHPERIRAPFTERVRSLPEAENPQRDGKGDLEALLARLVRPGANLMGIGSPRASLEANYALRTLVGPENFYAGLPETERDLIDQAIRIFRSGPVPAASLKEAAASDAVLILGEDVLNTAPLLALAVRQALRNQPLAKVKSLGVEVWNDTIVRLAMQQDLGPLFIASPAETGLDELAERTFRAAPPDLARLGFAIAHALDAASPPAPGLSEEMRSLAEAAAEALRKASRPLVISGVGTGSLPLVQAAANIAWALKNAGAKVSLCLAMAECNSFGLGLLCAGSLDEAFAAAASKKVDTLVILENDLYRRAGAPEADKFLEVAENVMVIDSLAGKTTERAQVVLPAGAYAESTGTLVNSEGRAQRFFRVLPPTDTTGESLGWLGRLLSLAGRTEGEKWRSAADIGAALAEELPVFAPLIGIAPGPEFRVGGQKIPRQSHRYSGRTAMTAHQEVHEPPPPEDPDSPLAFSMEGYGGPPPASLIPRYWHPSWNSVQSLAKFQSEVGGALRGGDPGQRLIEPAPERRPSFFTEIPDAFVPRKGEWLFIALHHIFGSEELSARGPAVAERAPRPYLALAGNDAEKLRLVEGSEVEVELSGTSCRLPLRIDDSLPPGTAGWPVGLLPSPWVPLPSWGRIAKTPGRDQ